MADPADTGRESSPRLEKGLQLLFAAEVAEEAVDAVDMQAVRAGAPVDDAVDPEQLGSALGRPLGRALAHRAVGDVAADGYPGMKIREAAGPAGARACRVALERVDADTLPVSLSPSVPGFAPSGSRDGDP
jgi:hypothetical protein